MTKTDMSATVSILPSDSDAHVGCAASVCSASTLRLINAAKMTEDRKLLKQCHDAMSDAIESWNNPDSPEAFAWEMKALMVQRERISARLQLGETKKSGKERKDC